jgi:hypothetical protein
VEWSPVVVEVLEYLISQGAEVNAKDKNGKTPMDIARPENKTYLKSCKMSWKNRFKVLFTDFKEFILGIFN